MHLTRCQHQSQQTLEEFYSELAQSTKPLSRECGTAMLGLLARLRALQDDRRVWALTSHHWLCLLAADSPNAPRLVNIVAMDSPNYFIEYLTPQHIAPWKGAYVKGEARSEDEAVGMILTAMEKSEGWSK